MNIIARNFLRLIRAGAFSTEERVEPMSAWKWRKTYELSLTFEVADSTAAGVKNLQDDFFLQLPDDLLHLWMQQGRAEDDDDNEWLEPFRLTNPLLNSRLQAILDDEQSDMGARQMLVSLLRFARRLLNKGLPLKNVVELGRAVRHPDRHCNYDQLNLWIRQLQLESIARLAAAMLTGMMGFEAEEIAFARNFERIGLGDMERELTDPRHLQAGTWQFGQGDAIFVHNSNNSALLNHLQRSMKNMRYYPAESATNFVMSFVHSLSHIEE